MTIILAHRGSSGTKPENTMEAFIAAEQSGADGIELDVQLTSDGEIVVIHDTTVDRTTNGSGLVKDFTLTSLQKLKANDHFKHFFKKASRIPTLIEVFEWMKDNTCVCNIELKNNIIPYEDLEKKVATLIRKYSYEKRMIISSFNHSSLQKMKEICPTVETAPLYNQLLYKPWEYASTLKASGIHPKLRIMTDDMIKTTMEFGVRVRPYTVNKRKDMKRLFQLNCSAIITDYPEKAVRLKERMK
ncbi:glycerophosphodiester phosphodiesterase [Lederbergia sp. NSJ-179]|uniref:glycerophosphodiester phosphodiesterase n=1 Tax=Lederbergia sp. NSJ-179 TaxID=2931402 RepID=UPI001FD4E886|nr:glycerophosphodiester phosphodiesterase [Lederbergia sp. NSJ-179]MCJ7839369.1 glycerophosphodiester phosphodiesterase [Lederbergia sp. NSJ-179]